ncbi:MAG: hypothetical protein KF799_14095 [Bdellovibrionales bacterium]|nr:hypothetical protein [Bdellovibrionales bacterium]
MKQTKREQAKQQKSRHQSFVQLQNTCPLCNSQLTIRVETYLEDYTLREEATCPKCQVLARVKDHKMQ